MKYQDIVGVSAVTQEISLNRSGLVADCIFPPVETGCKFGVVNWEDELKDLRDLNDLVTCKSDANEADFGTFKIANYQTQDRALTQVLDECCVVVCGSVNIGEKIAAQKTRALANSLLIGREKRAIALATATGSYHDNTTYAPNDSSAVIDGGLFKLDDTDFLNPNFKLLRYLQGINDHAKWGKRNTMVTDLATLNVLLTHPDFLGAGCIVDPKTTVDRVASLIGVSKICIADANYNDGIGDQLTLTKLWPAGTILFTVSRELITSEEPNFAFGLTAYTQQIQAHQWIDEKKGKGAGALIQKQGHDLTEVVLSYKAATLVKIVPGEE